MSMALQAPPLRLRVPAIAECVGYVRRAVADYARRLGMRDVSAIEIAVSETVTNAVVHAYVGVPEGEVAVTAEMPEGDGLLVAVSDDGAGLVPRPDSPGLGLGLALIAQLAASFEVDEPPGSGTTVRMHFAA